MIIDLRYHIVSLVAVFLALGLGILIGTTVIGNDALVKQQKQLTDRLEYQIKELRRESLATRAQNDILKSNYEKQKQFGQVVLPLLIKDKLSGYDAAIIETNSYGFSDDLIKTLRMAGVNVHSVTTLLDGFRIGDKRVRILNSLAWDDMSEEELVSRLINAVARAIAVGDNAQMVEYLSRAGLIKNEGNYGVPLDGIIIIGGCLDKQMMKAETIDLPLIDYFLNRKISVFGVEENTVLYSYMGEYQKKRISTVDNIDTIPGQLALVLAMSGKPGHYGMKPTAQNLLPELEL